MNYLFYIKKLYVSYFKKKGTIWSLMFLLPLFLQFRNCTDGSSRRIIKEWKGLSPYEFRKKIINITDICQTPAGHTYLYLAVLSNDPKKVKIVLQRMDADLEKISNKEAYKNTFNVMDLKHKYTPLTYAVSKHNKAIVEELVEKDYIDLYDKKHSSYNSLDLAMEQCKDKAISKIIVDAAKRRQGCDLVKKQLKSGNTPLYVAAKNGWKEVFDSILVQLSPNEDLFSEIDIKGRTILHRLARKKKEAYFGSVFSKILSNKEKTIECLFRKDRKDFSVFAHAYLPRHIQIMSPVQEMSQFISGGSKMFTIVLRSFNRLLSHDQRERNKTKINAEINDLLDRKYLTDRYAKELRRIVEAELGISAIVHQLQAG